MKKIIIAVVVIAIVVGAVLLWRTKSANTNAASGLKKTVAVQRGPILRNVQSTGLVASKLDVEIKCKASGEIVSLPFDISAQVSKGDLLLELDPTDEDRNVRKAVMSLEQSQARLNQSVSDLSTNLRDLSNSKQSAKVSLDAARTRLEDVRAKERRVGQLFEKKLVSREEYESAQTSTSQAQADYQQTVLKIDQLKTQGDSLDVKRQAVRISKTSLESGRIDLSIAEQRLMETKVYSPTEGTITALNVQTGQIISSGINNVGGGTSIMTVSDMSQLYILASIDESDLAEIKEGQPVTVTADAYPKQKFSGTVDRIAQKGQSTSNVVTFEVRIEVTSDNKNLLKPAMTANVEIVIEEKMDVLYVPSSAVFNEDQKQAAEAAASGKSKQPAASTAGGRSAGGASTARGGAKTGGTESGARQRRGDRAAGMAAQGARKIKQYVTVVAGDSTTEVREVEIGMTDGENIEIVSGLKEGEMVETREDAVSSKWSGSGDRQGPSGGAGAIRMMR